jgi:Lhr-like helicase
MEEDSTCLIVIGMDTMSVGVDISCIEDVIVIREPEDVDDLFQKFGQVGWDKLRIMDACAILYLDLLSLSILMSENKIQEI